MDTITLTLNHASVPAVLYGSPSPQVWLCLHGKGGRKEEAESFAQVVCPKGWQVLAIDLPGHGARSGGPELFTPWHAVPELRDLLSLSGQKWNRLALRAVSLGAWFSLLAFQDRPLDRALFVSPVLDMERLIQEMMSWAGVTESRLEAEGCLLYTSRSQTMTRLGFSSRTHWRVHRPVGPAPRTSTVSSGEIWEI